MITPRLWDHCVNHRGRETERFVTDYFGESRVRVLLIAGIGFDPRSVTVCEVLAGPAASRLTGLFIREERPDPGRELVKRAGHNYQQMKHLVPSFTEAPVRIFAADGAVVGGRNAVRVVNELSLGEYTDVVVDFSALSTGVAFPLVRLILGRLESIGARVNLHLLVTDEPTTDDQVFPTACDS